MSAQNEMNNEITITIAEVVATAVEVDIVADNLLPVTIANILDADFSNDDEAEFLQGVLTIEKMIEDIILSDHPEDFLLPSDDDLPPALKLLEYIDALKDYKFGARTLDRMDRRLRGENIVVEEKLTQLQKSEHPDYKDWCCPKCRRYYKGARALRFHMDRNICSERHNDLIVKATKEQIVSPKFLHTTAAMTDLVARSFMYKKNIEPELEEETIEEEKIYDYVVKTWIYDTTTEEVEYAGLWETNEWIKCWTKLEEAKVEFEYAIGTGEFVAVELIQIDADANEDRETILDSWEDSLSDYVEEEEEIDYIEPTLVEAKANLKKIKK